MERILCKNMTLDAHYLKKRETNISIFFFFFTRLVPALGSLLFFRSLFLPSFFFAPPFFPLYHCHHRLVPVHDGLLRKVPIQADFLVRKAVSPRHQLESPRHVPLPAPRARWHPSQIHLVSLVFIYLSL